MENKGEILLYQNPDGTVKIDVKIEDETVWLSQEQLVVLFGKAKSTISEHIKHVFEEGELEFIRTVRNFRTVRFEGNREVEREIEQISTCRKFRQVRMEGGETKNVTLFFQYFNKLTHY
jgi:hypothetical protein